MALITRKDEASAALKPELEHNLKLKHILLKTRVQVLIGAVNTVESFTVIYFIQNIHSV